MNHDLTRAAIVGSYAEDVQDEELAHLLENYLRPQTFTHPVIGTLTLDRRLDQFMGSISLNGHQVDLTVQSDLTDSAIYEIVKIVTDPTTVLGKLRHLFETEVLALKNSSRLESQQSALKAEGLRYESLPNSIGVSSDGSIEFWCGGADWFGGHSVVLRHRKDGDSWVIDLVG